MMKNKNDVNYIIDYLDVGQYALLGKNPNSTGMMILATSDSPSELLEHAYMQMNISSHIEVSDLVNIVMEFEMIEKFKCITIQNDFMKILDKMISKLSEKYNNDDPFNI